MISVSWFCHVDGPCVSLSYLTIAAFRWAFMAHIRRVKENIEMSTEFRR